MRRAGDKDVLLVTLYLTESNKDLEMIEKLSCKLLAKYKSANELLFAGRDVMAKDDNVSENLQDLICIIHELWLHLREKQCVWENCDKLDGRKIYDNLKYQFDRASCERALMICFKENNSFFEKVFLAEGQKNQVEMPVKKILEYVVKNKIKSFILVHNHTSPPVAPSQQDVYFTKLLKNLMEMIDVTLIDHVIVGYREYYSMRESDADFWNKLE